MNRITRFVGVLCAAVCCASLLASSASALTVSPTGTYSVTTNPSFKIVADGIETGCNPVVANWTFNADGSGTVPAGSIAHRECGNATFGHTDISQPLAWSVKVVKSSSPLGVQLVITIPANGLSFKPNAVPECAFSVGGTITAFAGASSFPATVSAFAPQSSALKITSGATGLCATFAGTGMQVSSLSKFNLGKGMTVSG